MARMSSPTGKNHVVKVLENLVFTSRASCNTFAAGRSTCLSFSEASAHTGRERKGDQGTVAPVDLGGVRHDGKHADLLQRRHRPLAPGFGDPRVLL